VPYQTRYEYIYHIFFNNRIKSFLSPRSLAGDGNKCVDAAAKALALNPKALKALLRRCEGYILLNNCEKANEMLEEAKKYADEAALVVTNDLKKRIVKLEKEQTLKQKEMFSHIFK